VIAGKQDVIGGFAWETAGGEQRILFKKRKHCIEVILLLNHEFYLYKSERSYYV